MIGVRLMLAISVWAGLCLPVAAQLVPAPSAPAPPVCPDRATEPDLVTDMDVREAHRAILLRNMYKAAAYETIATTGACTCDQRFPDWEPIVAHYLETYAGEVDRNVLRERQSFYLRSSNLNRPAVRRICMAAGNWG
jgi:hypothetical protein